jgi:hypothetical protein
MTFTESGSGTIVPNDFPPENLTTYEPSLYWLSTTKTDPILFIDRNDSSSIDTLVIDTHNMMTGDNPNPIVLEASTNGTSSWTTVVTDLTVAETSVGYYTFALNQKRYFRIRYSGSLTDYPLLGGVLLGRKIDVPQSRTYNWGYKFDDPTFNTNEVITIGGRPHASQTSDGKLDFELSFTMMTDEFRESFARFVGQVRGRLYPFAFINYNDQVRFVRFSEDYTPMQVMKYNLNDLVNLKLRGVSNIKKVVTPLFIVGEFIDSDFYFP